MTGKLDVRSIVQIYSWELVHLSVCAPGDLAPNEVEDDANRQSPTGLSSRWQIDPDEGFRSGEPNGCSCNSDPERRHWLLSC